MITINIETGQVSLKKNVMNWYLKALAKYPGDDNKEQLTSLLVRVPKVCELTTDIEDRESNEFPEVSKYLADDYMKKQALIDAILTGAEILPHTDNNSELEVIETLWHEGYLQVEVDGKFAKPTSIEMLEDGTIHIEATNTERMVEINGGE